MFALLATSLLAMSLLMFLGLRTAWAQQNPDWTGQWQTYWRDGAALMMLSQNGDAVMGTFDPGDGRIEGRIDGHVLRGRWIEGDISGGIVFALAEGGLTFTGRYDSGEYWNGKRVTAGDTVVPRLGDASSPRETLKSLVAAVNDFVVGGNVSALRYAQSLLVYAGDRSDPRALNHRRALLWDLIDLSTFRIYDAPPRPAGDTATFRIGPAGQNSTYALQFVKGDDGRWQLLVEEEAVLSQTLRQFLEVLGHPSVASVKEASAQSPRGVMERFLYGVHNWDAGGQEDVLATLDLSFLPEHLRTVEGSVLTDYLKQIIDRAGFVIFQEIPNDPSRAAPFVHYEHPVGHIVIGRASAMKEDEPARWLFSAETLRNAPALYAAVQDLPPAPGIAPQTPLTRFFLLREQIRETAPNLLHRSFILENWQWFGIVAMTSAAVLFAFVIGRFASRLPVFGLLTNSESPTSQTPPSLVWALRLAVAGLLLSWAFSWIGIVETDLAILYRLMAIIAVIGITWLAYHLVGLLGAHFLHKAQNTTSYTDEIVTSLATGIVKLGIVIGGVILLAEIVDLPYEGVLAGLGVGGIALAFASRETVSNMLGGILLLTDSPFKRGDLIETHGDLATVETVGLRSTRLKRLDDTIMIIPNAQLSDKVIINWGIRKRRRVDLSIGLTYDTPRAKLDRFVSELHDVILQQPRADREDCYIGLKDFGSSSIDIECRCFFNVYGYEAQIRARHALIGDIIDLAEKLDVKFAFPTRTIHVLNSPEAATEID